MYRKTLAAVLGGAVALGGACERKAGPSAEPARQVTAKEESTMNLTSRVFGPNETIPKRFTGDGADFSPPLTWSLRDMPEETAELALVCDDPDAPGKQPWVHWVLYKIPRGCVGLSENVAKTQTLDQPKGAMQGRNSWGNIGYGGPAPPEGHGRHHYHFKLYALDAELDVQPGLTKDELLFAMHGHVLATGELIGTYER